MLAHRQLAGTALLVLAVAISAIAQQPQPEERLTWETNLEAAQRRAAETNRLVLSHFGGPWCQHCVKLEREVFSQPGFGRELTSDYVAVKLDLPQHKAVAARYGVDYVPTDVITTAQGQVIQKMNSPRTVAAYLAAMSQVAADARAKRAIDSPAGGPGQPRLDGGDRYASQAPRGDVHPAAAAGRYASAPAYEGKAPASSHREGPLEPSPPRVGRPFAEAGADELPQLPAGSPPLALEGFCPVTLCEKKAWAAGDIRFGAIHRRRTYLFAGEAEQKAFLADPDRFAPVLDGNDPVLALERSQAVRGSRDHGIHYGRIYLFASEETLNAFCKNPERYAVELRQARRPKR